MISAASIDAAGSVFPETRSAAKSGDTSESGFLDIFSSASQECADRPDTKAVSGDGEASKLGPDEEDTDSPARDVLDQLLQLAALIGQYAGPADQEVVSTVQETITGVLEGNGVSGDTDIASALTGLQTCFAQLGSKEKEAILARMPQATTLLQEPNRAATGNTNQIDSIPCPLENFSEPAEDPAGPGSPSGGQQVTEKQTAESVTATAAAGDTIRITASAAGDEPVAAAVNGDEAASSADAISQAGTPVTQTDTEKNILKTPKNQTEAVNAAAETADESAVAAAAAEEAGDGDMSPDTDVEGDETQTARTNEAEGASSRDFTETVGTAAAFTAANTDQYANDDIRTAADNALTKLSDILTSYDGSENKRFEIQLEPENLGKLSITLTMGDDGLRAQIRAKDTQIQSLLSSEISTLVDKLSENGVQIKSLDVICADMGGEQLGGQNTGGMFNGQSSGQNQSRYPDDILSAYEETGSSGIYAWADEGLLGSTVSLPRLIIRRTTCQQ